MRLADGAPEETPPELRLYWMCQRFNCLPESGGLLEQDAGLLGRMTLLGTVYQTVQRVRSLRGAEIHKMNADDGRLLAWLETRGIQVF